MKSTVGIIEMGVNLIKMNAAEAYKEAQQAIDNSI